VSNRRNFLFPDLKHLVPEIKLRGGKENGEPSSPLKFEVEHFLCTLLRCSARFTRHFFSQRWDERFTAVRCSSRRSAHLLESDSNIAARAPRRRTAPGWIGLYRYAVAEFCVPLHLVNRRGNACTRGHSAKFCFESLGILFHRFDLFAILGSEQRGIAFFRPSAA